MEQASIPEMRKDAIMDALIRIPSLGHTRCAACPYSAADTARARPEPPRSDWVSRSASARCEADESDPQVQSVRIPYTASATDTGLTVTHSPRRSRIRWEQAIRMTYRLGCNDEQGDGRDYVCALVVQAPGMVSASTPV